MIHIKYKLNTSAHHGIGLFVDEALTKGQLIYTPSPRLDVNLTQEEFDSLEKREQEEMQYWGFFDTNNQKWHVDFDVSHFINHSYEATVTQHPEHSDTYLVATRDVAQGEELTQNYLEFETEEDLRRRGIA